MNGLVQFVAVLDMLQSRVRALKRQQAKTAAELDGLGGTGCAIHALCLNPILSTFKESRARFLPPIGTLCSPYTRSMNWVAAFSQ